MTEKPDAGRRGGLYLAVDAGGTSHKSALIGRDGAVVPESRYRHGACADGSVTEILEVYRSIIEHGARLADRLGMEIAGVGVATPGPFDYRRGASLMRHKYRAVYDLPLREELVRRRILPAGMPIVFVQDVHAFLGGERWAGAITGIADAVALTLGTGLGFGVMADGRILDNGSGGPHAVVYDRACGPGILEDRVSRRGIISAYRARREEAVEAPDAQDIAGRGSSPPDGSEPDIDVHDIAARAVELHDRAALEVFSETGTILAVELGVLIAGYRPERIVFGGMISRSFELFGPSFTATLQRAYPRNVPVPEVVPGEHLETSSLLGAAQAVMEREALGRGAIPGRTRSEGAFDRPETNP